MSSRLVWFLAASAALHLAVLAAGPWSAQAPRLGAPPGGPRLLVRVGLQAAAPAARVHPQPHAGPAQRIAERARPQPARFRRAHRPAHRRTRAEPHAPQAVPDVRPRARPAPARVAAAAARSVSGSRPAPSKQARAAPTPAGGGAAAAAQFLRAALLRLLGTHFDYPWVARRRGWEGEVRLAMRVGASGRVSDLRVVGTSGYRVLDRAALRSARHIRKVPDAGRWLHGRSVDIVVPVEYRLVNG